MTENEEVSNAEAEGMFKVQRKRSDKVRTLTRVEISLNSSLAEKRKIEAKEA